MRILLPFVLAVWLAGFLSGAAQACPVRWNETLDVVLDPETGVLSGRITWKTDTSSSTPSSTIRLYLHPRNYLSPDADLDDVNETWRLPGGFSSGDMTLEGISATSSRSSNTVVEVTSVDPAEFSVGFQTTFPRRNGPFGLSPLGVVALGGWYPQILCDSPSGASGSQLHSPSHRTIRIRVSQGGGLLVVGTGIRRIQHGRAVVVEVSTPGPVPLFYYPEFRVVRWQSSARTPLTVTGIVSGSVSAGSVRRMQSVVSLVGEQLEHLPDHHRPRRFLVVQAPLREAPVLPFPGGIAISDRLFRLLPSRKLMRRHVDSLNWMTFAGSLLIRPEWTLDDVLVWIRLTELLGQRQGDRESLFLRELFRRGEVLATMDNIGTDPQTGFESVLFFRAAPPGELDSLPERAFGGGASPTYAASQILALLGDQVVAELLEQALSGSEGVLDGLRRSCPPESREALEHALLPRSTDLVLHQVTPSNGRWRARVCKAGDLGPLVVEGEARRGRKVRRFAQLCSSECCDLDVGDFRRVPRVQLDPEESMLQVSMDGSDPRRNDRSHSDIKWMIARPVISMARGDVLPSVSFELVMQPRYDLRHQAFLGPFLSPDRLTVAGGYRLGFGPKIRPNLKLGTLSLGLRSAWGLTARDDVSLGPLLSVDLLSAGNRPNPSRGGRLTGYAYPYFSSDFAQLGLRSGIWSSGYAALHASHILAAALRVDGVWGWFPGWESIQVGGVGGLRGLPSSGFARRYRLGGSLEYRWMLFQDQDYSVLDVTFLRGFQLALFADAASLVDRWGDTVRRDRFYVDVGFGLRPHVQWFGFVPGLMSLDFAWMLPVGAMGETGFGVLFGMIQPF